VQEGQEVKSGELLIEFDIPAIKAAGLSTVTPMVIANSDDYSSVKITDRGTITVGEEIISVQK
jgi:PTS system beta-glucosides-specific IIC component